MTPFARVMLVDDDEDDREIFLHVVTTMFPDIDCVVANNGQDALDKLSMGLPRPDVIFLDLNMPLMNGRQFLNEVRRRGDLKGIPVVVLTTSSDMETISETTRLGAKHFITKPHKLSGWKESLRNVFVNPGFSH